MINIDKCKVMQIGKSNSNACYVMGDEERKGVKHWIRLMKKSTLGLSWVQIKRFQNTAYWVLSMIYSTFTCMSSDIQLPLCKSLVKPHLELIEAPAICAVSMEYITANFMFSYNYWWKYMVKKTWEDIWKHGLTFFTMPSWTPFWNFLQIRIAQLVHKVDLQSWCLLTYFHG